MPRAPIKPNGPGSGGSSPGFIGGLGAGLAGLWGLLNLRPRLPVAEGDDGGTISATPFALNVEYMAYQRWGPHVNCSDGSVGGVGSFEIPQTFSAQAYGLRTLKRDSRFTATCQPGENGGYENLLLAVKTGPGNTESDWQYPFQGYKGIHTWFFESSFPVTGGFTKERITIDGKLWQPQGEPDPAAAPLPELPFLPVAAGAPFPSAVPDPAPVPRVVPATPPATTPAETPATPDAAPTPRLVPLPARVPQSRPSRPAVTQPARGTPPNQGETTTITRTFTTPRERLIEAGMPFGSPGQAPPPTMQGIAAEVGRIEQKLAQVLRDQTNPGNALADLLRTIIGEAIGEAIGELFSKVPASDWTYTAPCDRNAEDLPEEAVFQIAELSFQQATIARLEALADVMQTLKNWKQPVCRTRPPLQNVTVTAHEYDPAIA